MEYFIGMRTMAGYRLLQRQLHGLTLLVLVQFLLEFHLLLLPLFFVVSVAWLHRAVRVAISIGLGRTRHITHKVLSAHSATSRLRRFQTATQQRHQRPKIAISGILAVDVIHAGLQIGPICLSVTHAMRDTIPNFPNTQLVLHALLAPTQLQLGYWMLWRHKIPPIPLARNIQHAPTMLPWTPLTVGVLILETLHPRGSRLILGQVSMSLQL